MRGKTYIVDLKSAYLQVRVTEDLWQHQLVKFKYKVFCLTQLGFGLGSAPMIMSKILKCVLKKDEKVGVGPSSYIADIYVNRGVVTGEAVVDHLQKHGLTAKAPAALDGEAALGLRLRRGDDGRLVFGRANDTPDVPGGLTKKELLSVCGKLVDHNPVAEWLRAVCSYMKRQAERDRWRDYVADATR